MYNSRRQSSPRWLMGFVLGVFLSTGLLIFLALNSEALNRRIEAIPFYLRTYVSKFRPNVDIPAPPDVSAIAPEALLEASPDNDTSDTPAYFNETALNPTEPVSEDANPVALVQSDVLSPAPVAPQVALTGIVAEDSLNGSDIQVPMAEFDTFWQVFNRTYVVVYPSDKVALVHAIIGQEMIDQTMLERALATA